MTKTQSEAERMARDFVRNNLDKTHYDDLPSAEDLILRGAKWTIEQAEKIADEDEYSGDFLVSKLKKLLEPKT